MHLYDDHEICVVCTTLFPSWEYLTYTHIRKTFSFLNLSSLLSPSSPANDALISTAVYYCVTWDVAET